MNYTKEQYETLKYKDDAGEPMSEQRARIRKQCKPKGAVGYLLESVHLNQACMDVDFNIWQYNQPPIRIRDAAYQVLGPQVQQMATRNRTRRMEGTREECIDLEEIDREATNVKIKDASDNDYMILNLTRAGSNWTRVAAHRAGQTESDKCYLCVVKEKDQTTCGFAMLCEKKGEKQTKNLEQSIRSVYTQPSDTE